MLYKNTRVFNPYKPRTSMYNAGGSVTARPTMTLKQKGNDSVLAILRPGEVVIPVRHFQKKKQKWMNLASTVKNDLKKQGVMLPGF